MPSITIRKVPDEVHRALKLRAAQHGHSAEAEMRDILEKAVMPEDRRNFGSLMTSIVRETGGLTDEEVEFINNLREKTYVEPINFDDHFDDHS